MQRKRQMEKRRLGRQKKKRLNNRDIKSAREVDVGRER